MYAHERRRKIAEILQTRSFGSVDQLAALLNVSVATIRRDLTQLVRANQVARVHGGAVSLLHERFTPMVRSEEPAAYGSADDTSELAQAAFKSIANGQTVALDGGTACEKLAALLPLRTHLTVLVSSMTAAWGLRNAWHLRVLCLGGEMLHADRVNRGAFALSMIDQINFDKAFIDIQGIDPERGLTINDPAETAIKQALMRQAREVVVMATHASVGHVAPVKIAEAGGAHRVIAHAGAATAPVLEKLQRSGVQITFV